MKCPICQAENFDRAEFCTKCGLTFQKGKPPPAIDRHLSGPYTPEFLLHNVLNTISALEGEKKEVTILFAEVADSDCLCEIFDPETTHSIMNICFSILINEVQCYDGFVNQFTGNGIMAIFGAPRAIERHAHHACRAALAIKHAIENVEQKLKPKNGFKFNIRVGLSSGSVIATAIGGYLRKDYTAIGDAANLAARMKSMAKPGEILISPNTYKRVAREFIFKKLGKRMVKGKEKPLHIYLLTKETLNGPRLGFERRIFSEIVGREKELNKLELQINKAVNGAGSVINIIGEAGIGKSRLIEELKKADDLNRIWLLEGRAVSIGKNLRFHPFVHLLKNWSHIDDEDTAAVALYKLEAAIKKCALKDANEIFPFVATLMGIKPAGRHAERISNIDGEALEKLIYKNLRALLIKLSEIKPVVIVIEDLQWADISSIELLESLIGLSETHGIAFINVLRPNHPNTSNRFIKAVKDRPNIYSVELELKPLSNATSEALIKNMINFNLLNRPIVEEIVRRSGGNPFFIEELVQTLIDEGLIVKNKGQFVLYNKPETMVLPETIKDVLTARIDRLEDKTRELIKIAAVMGIHFFYRILKVVAAPINDIDDRLAYLKEIDLICEHQVRGETEYFFKHALTQETVYQSILPDKRKYLHLQVARAIERFFTDRIPEFYGILTVHFIRSDQHDESEKYLIKAGEEALRTSASNEALNYYLEGLNLYLHSNTNSADPEKLAMFEKNIALAFYNKCRWFEAVHHIDKVLEYWRVPYRNSKYRAFVGCSKNLLLLFTGFDRIDRNSKAVPDQRENEILDLFYKKTGALVYIDTFKFLMNNINGFNRSTQFNVTKSPEAFRAFISLAGVLAFGGISFKIAHRLLNITEAQMDKNNFQDYISYILMRTINNFVSGDWRESDIFEKSLVKKALAKGMLFDATSYMLYFYGKKKSAKANFQNVTYILASFLKSIIITIMIWPRCPPIYLQYTRKLPRETLMRSSQ